MLTLRKVAITGGLSSGKSSVCQIFQELGAYIVSADEIVHRLLAPQSPVSEKIIELLGQEAHGLTERKLLTKFLKIKSS